MALDEKGKVMYGRLEFFDRNVQKLSKHLTTMVKQHKAGVGTALKFSERVRDIAAQEPFPDLQDRLVGLSEITERQALERKEIMCERAESQVLDKLAFVQNTVISPTKVLLKDRDASIRALIAAHHKRDKAEAQGKDVQLAVSDAEMTELKQQLTHTEKVVDNNMELFEGQRVEDMKDILEEFIRCEMYYHCRALEVLAPVLTHLQSIESDAARENVRTEIAKLNRTLNYPIP